jgi:hypothetical protein
MPIPIEQIQAVEDEIEREHKTKVKTDTDNEDDDHETSQTTAMTPPDQDFSFLKNPLQPKRSVHYDIEQVNNHEESRPLRTIHETEQPLDNVIRRRYIAHWGLPGRLTSIT